MEREWRTVAEKEEKEVELWLKHVTEEMLMERLKRHKTEQIVQREGHEISS